MTWHVDSALLERYRSDQLSDSRMASVEMHITACPRCRALVVAEADGATQDAWARVKQAVDERLDEPPMAWLQRGLRRMGVNERDAGVLGATLSLHGSWVGALALAMTFVVLASLTGPERVGLAAFLVAAPLVPLAGVAVAYGPRVDPTYEIAVAASVPTARVILLRTLAVTVPALPLIMVLSLLVPGGLLAFAWLLPALGLATASLALGTVLPLNRAAVGLAGAWVIAAVASLTGAPRTSAEAFVRGFAAFRPAGQLVCAAVAVVSAVLAALRRYEFETAR